MTTGDLPPPVRLFLLRHGEVEERYHHTFGGRIDMKLSALGHRQAAKLARFVVAQKIDAIYASPMKRVQQTLAPLIEATALAPVVMEELREVDFGDWTGLNRDQVREQFYASASEWLARIETGRMPNAEPVEAFRHRSEQGLHRILRHHTGQSVAVLCHGGVIRMMVAMLLELPLSAMAKFDFEYASLTQIDVHPNKTRVKLLNFVPWRDESLGGQWVL